MYQLLRRNVNGSGQLGFRLRPKAKLFCHKAISTLRYIISYWCGDAAVARFVNTLELQMLMLIRQSAGVNLDEKCALNGPRRRSSADPNTPRLR
jgi:hypothetical protein